MYIISSFAERNRPAPDDRRLATAMSRKIKELTGSVYSAKVSTGPGVGGGGERDLHAHRRPSKIIVAKTMRTLQCIHARIYVYYVLL